MKTKKVQKQKGFVDAKISPPRCPHLAYQPRYLSANAHYTRFVLKTVRFIGGRCSCLSSFWLSAAGRLFYYLKESATAHGGGGRWGGRTACARDKSDL